MNNKQSAIIRVSGLLIYLAGAALGVALLTLVIWPDIEASSFDSAIRADKQLRSLHCPVFLTRDEIGTISITVDNTTDREVNPTVRARITKGYRTFVQEFRQKVAIPAGGSETVSWEVERKDAAYDRSMILGRFYQMRNYSLPSRTSTCGIYVLPFSGPNGQQVLIGAYVASLVLMAFGLFLQLPKDRKALMRSNVESNKRRRNRLQGFTYLGAILLIGTLLALIGNWLLSSVLAVLVATSIIGVISYALIAQ